MKEMLLDKEKLTKGPKKIKVEPSKVCLVYPKTPKFRKCLVSYSKRVIKYW